MLHDYAALTSDAGQCAADEIVGETDTRANLSAQQFVQLMVIDNDLPVSADLTDAVIRTCVAQWTVVEWKGATDIDRALAG